MAPTAAEIVQTRAALGLTQAQCAALRGVSRVTWARYEAGSRAITGPDWQHFLHVAGIARIPFHGRKKGA